MALPNFVVIGAQKSASTFLRACLNDHPDIYVPYEEIPFFESPDYDETSIAALEALFEGKPQRFLGIKRPSYLARREVAARLQRHVPEARLLAVLRNPVDRAVSAYFHYINGGVIPPLDIETGLRLILDDSSFRSQYQRSSEIIDFGLYENHLRNYEFFLDQNRLLILLHDDISKDALSSVQQTYKFIGASDTFVPASLHSRPMKVTYNLTRLKFLNNRHKYMTVYNATRTRRHAKRMTMFDYAAAGLILGVDRLLLSKILDNRKPAISKDLQHRLLARFENDMTALEALTGRDLAAWRQVK
jgi:hypothetical protein